MGPSKHNMISHIFFKLVKGTCSFEKDQIIIEVIFQIIFENYFYKVANAVKFMQGPHV